MDGIRAVCIVFPKEEHDALIRAKGTRTWREFLLTLVDSPRK